MKLNKKQKLYLFTEILDKDSLYKIFETADIDWLCSLEVKIEKPDKDGWRPLIVDGRHETSLNFDLYGERWNEILDNIEDYEYCQWCEEWFHKDEIIFRKRGFTRLCHQCNSYLISREGGA